ncbi:glycosyltransferase [Rhodococcoides corynebacterioides]|uniref:glycosyltransferase n=1 Tax=Rhodococcoides corynebacterioides TaxID=53972 RepID=UPI001C9B20F3|nr:glycosyltransferase [Rhodococcus corynebacterioides]
MTDARNVAAWRTPQGTTVPGNRWDLLDGVDAAAVSVSVVVPYYRQQNQLSMVLAALERQDFPRDRLEVIVADDGSPEPPQVECGIPVTVVTQEDRGFRAAAARNLGAAAATGDVLCFLDADTVPEPGYVRALVRLPSLIPDALTVGRRRHADLTALGRLPEPGDPLLDEPGWLLDAYRGSRNLLDADDRSYRHVISAVMCCRRTFFDEVGGFDESFTSYGGEDWELANRAWLAGAVLAHVPTAVAWHDGPDWAGRPDDRRRDAKNGEAMALAPLVTDPAARRHGVRYAVPDVTAVVHSEGHTAASLMVTVGSILRHGDVTVWVDGAEASSFVGTWGIDDPRVRVGSPTAADTARSRFAVEVGGRAVLGETAFELLAGVGAGGSVRCTLPDGAFVVHETWRARRRARRWAPALGVDDGTALGLLFGSHTVDGHAVDVTTGPLRPDLSW